MPDGELLLTGAASLPDALTFGDVDLHLRVRPESFDATVEALRGVYALVHPEIWQIGFATFEIPGADLPTGVALTAIDGEHDRLFLGSWRRLASDRLLLTEYNDTKLRHVGGDPEAYRAAKSAFFVRLGRRPATPAHQEL